MTEREAHTVYRKSVTCGHKTMPFIQATSHRLAAVLGMSLAIILSLLGLAVFPRITLTACKVNGTP